MRNRKSPPTHPGGILKRHYMEPLALTVSDLSDGWNYFSLIPYLLHDALVVLNFSIVPLPNLTSAKISARKLGTYKASPDFAPFLNTSICA